MPTPVSFCTFEARVQNPKTIKLLELDDMPPAPTLSVCSLSLKTMVNPRRTNMRCVWSAVPHVTEQAGHGAHLMRVASCACSDHDCLRADPQGCQHRWTHC